MAQQESKKTTKKKVPTALKRVKQSQVKRNHNRALKSRIRTATRSFEAALSSKNQDETKAALSQLYSLLDRGVKTKVYKKNKVARDKSRLAHLARV
ncbi:MAG: 30S ribosomal protein S20 [Chlamydiota bacterium]